MPKPDKLRLLADHYQCDVGFFLGHPGIRPVSVDDKATIAPRSTPENNAAADQAQCPGCFLRDTEIAYLKGIVSDLVATNRALSVGVCRYPTAQKPSTCSNSSKAG